MRRWRGAVQLCPPQAVDRCEVATLSKEFELNLADSISGLLDDETLKSLDVGCILIRERLGATRAQLLGLKEIERVDVYCVYGRG